MRHTMRAACFTLAVVLLCSLAAAMGRKDAPERKDQRTADSAAVREGISGRVEIWEGNFMPMMEPGRARSQIRPGAGRRVRVHEPVIVAGGLAAARRDSIASALVAETVCDSAGSFLVAVKPGTYSVFVEEEGGWYFNGWNGQGVQGAVVVESGKLSEVLVKVTTKATF